MTLEEALGTFCGAGLMQSGIGIPCNVHLEPGRLACLLACLLYIFRFKRGAP